MGKINIRKAFIDLDNARKLAEITIEEVALLCGVTPLTYKRWRKGESPRKNRLETLKSVTAAIKREHKEKMRLFLCR